MFLNWLFTWTEEEKAAIKSFHFFHTIILACEKSTKVCTAWCSDAVALSDCCGEERAETIDKALDLLLISVPPFSYGYEIRIITQRPKLRIQAVEVGTPQDSPRRAGGSVHG